MREIYLDNAATTRVLPEAADAASAAMREQYGNPSSLHHKGFEAEQYVKNARKAIAGRKKGCLSAFRQNGTSASRF